MRKLFLCFFLPFTAVLFAQTGNTADYHNLELAGKRINLLANPIFLTEVIDATGTNDAPIGTAHKGLTNRAVQIVFSGGMHRAFNDLLAGTPQDAKHKKAKIRITGITDNEFIGNTEVRKVEMEAELAVDDENGYRLYGPVRYVDIHFDVDVTAGHAQAVVTSFDTLARRLTRLYVNGEDYRQIKPAEVNDIVTGFAINGTDFTQIPDGFYETFMDFRAARPGIDIEPDIRREFDPFTDEDGRVFDVLTFKKPKSIKGREFNGYWGAHIGGKPYMKIQDYYFEIKRDDSLGLAVALPSRIYLQSSNGTAVGAASAMFGLVGGLVAAALTSNDNKDYELYQFSPRSGLVTPRRTLNRPDSVAGVLISSSSFSSKKLSLHVSTENGKQKLLTPGSHLQLGSVSEVCFTVEGAEPVCEAVEASSAPLVLYQLTLKNNGNYRLELMPNEEAVALARMIKKGVK